MRRLILTWLLMGIWSGFSLPTFAQWADQTIVLRPGWNAAHLEVRPAPAECDAIFAGLPIESAWAWNRRAAAVQYIQDPSTLVPPQADWLTWLPSTHPLAKQMNLFSLEGGRTYLIKVADNAAPVTLNLR